MSGPVPSTFGSARTLTLLRESSGGEMHGLWLYYERPTRDYVERVLRARGAPTRERQSAADLAHDALVTLLETVIPRYDPTRGPFRPYFKRAIRWIVLDHLREQASRPTGFGERAEELAALPEPVDAELDRAFDGVDPLKAWGRRVFEEFVRSEPDVRQRDVELLVASVVDAAPQQALASQYGLSPRQIRNAIKSAADRFAPWAEAHFDPDEYAALVARADPEFLPAAFGRKGLRALFDHPSERKRLVILALLARLYSG